MISLGCLSLSNFEGKQVNVPTLSHKKKPTLTPTTGGCLLILIKPSRSPSGSAPFLFNQFSYALVKKYHNIILASIIHILNDLFPNQHPPPSVQQLCAGSLPCLRTWTSWLPLKKPFVLHSQCYWAGHLNTYRFATCVTSSLLLGPFSLPVGWFLRVKPSCNTSLTFLKGPLHVAPFSRALEWYQPLSPPLHWNLPRHLPLYWCC